MKVKVTIDLADKAQAAAFQNLVSAQAAAAQKPSRLSVAHAEAIAAIKSLPDAEEQEHSEDVATLTQPATKKTRAPRKTQATEEQPVDTAAAENVEVNEPEEVTPAAETTEEEAQQEQNDSEYTIDELRQRVADNVNAHRVAIKAKLSELGAASVTLLAKENYPAFMAFLNTLK